MRDEPVFEPSLLLVGEIKVNDVRRQLSRWTRSGKIYPLRRGLYTLAPSYQKVKPHPLEHLNWKRAMEDVSPFLEPTADPHLLSKEHFIKLLIAR